VVHEHTHGPKRKSLIAFVVLMSWVPIVMVLTYIPPFPWSEFLSVLPALAIVAGIWKALRIRCPHCGVWLATNFPFWNGGGILLWAANEKCPKCSQPLGWK